MNATDTKTYRGRTLEEVLPKIKADLGPDAEIVRQRSGLTGGVGGFFQRQCVEIDAKAPVERERRRRFDAYDEDPGRPAARGPQPAEPEPDPFDSFIPELPESEGLSAPGIQEIFRQAEPFAEQLSQALEPVAPAQPPAERPAKAEELVATLTGAGLASALASDIVDRVVANELP